MAYRDELEALRARFSVMEAENDRLKARLRGEQPLRSRPVDPRWHSVRGGEPTTVRISNASPRKVQILWLSYDGRERDEGTLVPRGETAVQTYVGFCWRFVDAETGEVLEHQRVQRPGETLTYGD